ncbi:MAG: sigma-54-dependent Fis family transcriptional regulator [Magnetococcales bacterium]|nr:sigma-54-dependent Fis family transcriptional regulator [Magnetococcales bacterium]NGZ26168.1 sigma-54-dependent Fis family transcriptional regulator [Magnetococcales bacterium]
MPHRPQPQDSLITHDPSSGLIVTPGLEKMLRMARKIASTNRPLLITGETGTSKGVLAHWIRAHSSRWDKPCQRINCGNLQGEVGHAMLFGTVEGGFTGARKAVGILSQCNGGTLIMDDLDALTVTAQTAILDILDTGQIRPIGGPEQRQVVDVRFIFTSNRQLKGYDAPPDFRPDLYYRIRHAVLHIPSLRERRQDIPLLARHILDKLKLEHDPNGDEPWSLEQEAMEYLREQPWQGNYRDLQFYLEHVANFHDNQCTLITLKHLFDAENLLSGNQQRPGTTPKDDELFATLNRLNWNISLTAKRTGMCRGTIYNRINRNGWTRPR